MTTTLYGLWELDDARWVYAMDTCPATDDNGLLCFTDRETAEAYAADHRVRWDINCEVRAIGVMTTEGE